ncbi:MAG: hypothetical protein AAFW00_05840 [Bacteroidota bacterium]
MLKYILTFVCVGFFILDTAVAQSFFGYQSIGTNTFYFSLTWDGEPHLGLGYNLRRRGGGNFLDYSLEWQMPIDDLWQFREGQIIGGIYGPVRLRRRPFFALGGHARLLMVDDAGEKSVRFLAAATGIPSYTYAASVNNRPYGTIGLRGTYLLTLGEWKKKDGETIFESFSRHGAEVGGHVDLLLERTLGAAGNIFVQREWRLKDKENAEPSGWNLIGNAYLGSTYWRLQ